MITNKKTRKLQPVIIVEEKKGRDERTSENPGGYSANVRREQGCQNGYAVWNI